MIVEGDIAVVDTIMKKHGVKYRAADFYLGMGYDFIINDDRAADLTALNELGIVQMLNLVHVHILHLQMILKNFTNDSRNNASVTIYSATGRTSY